MSELDLPSQIGGRYRPVRLIGKGGMGVVYEVEHLHTGQRLALKLLTRPGGSVERFKREARAASRIQSDHIVRVTDADVAPELGGAPFLVMELLQGADLERTTGDRPSSPADVLTWLRQVARALARAHDSGLVHRDLKPENLFLTQREDGSPLVKILDFGIVKMATEGDALTQSNGFLGTPGYMAPEQTDSRGPPVTFRADLFALGLIAFKLLIGRSYWRSGSLAQLFAQILAEPMPPPSERGSSLGAAFDAWFLRACDRDPNNRFGSAGEEVEALAVALGQPEEVARVSDGLPRAATPSVRDTLSSMPTLSASATDLGTVKKRLTRRRWLAGGTAGAAASIAVVSFFMRGGARRDGPSVHILALDPRVSAPARASSEPTPSSTPPSATVALVAARPSTIGTAPPLSSSMAALARPKAAGAPAGKSNRTSGVVDMPKARDPLEGAY